MAPKKKTVKKTTKRSSSARSTAGNTKKSTRMSHEMIDRKTVGLLKTPAMMRDPRVRKFWKTPSFYFGFVVIILGVLLLLNKSWWLAAMVNGRPIYRWDLNKVMTARFGQQTLEGVISEQLIGMEADKAGVKIEQAELDAKIAEIMKGFGENVKLEDLLQMQGMSKEDFEKQLRLQLTVERILGKDVAVTDEDVANYIASNSAFMTATDEASLAEEAREAIRTQKINDKVQTWFAELKSKANILRFL